MRFKLDENMDVRVASVLVSAGHGVQTAGQEGLAGAVDELVGATANRESRLLVTLDKGFGDVRRYPPGSHAGIVVLRLRRQSLRGQIAGLELLVGYEGLEDLAGCTAVVTPASVRVRRPT